LNDYQVQIHKEVPLTK